MEAIFSTNDINNYSVSELNYTRETIENMNKFNQIEVLRIVHALLWIYKSFYTLFNIKITFITTS